MAWLLQNLLLFNKIQRDCAAVVKEMMPSWLESVHLSGEERDAQCLEQGRVLVHVLAPTLFNMPSIFDKVGQLVNLPHPTMQLP